MRKKNKKIKMPNSYFIEKDIKNYDFSPRITNDKDGNPKLVSINVVAKKG